MHQMFAENPLPGVILSAWLIREPCRPRWWALPLPRTSSGTGIQAQPLVHFAEVPLTVESPSNRSWLISAHTRHTCCGRLAFVLPLRPTP